MSRFCALSVTLLGLAAAVGRAPGASAARFGSSGGFDRAIAAVIPRVVKLYGLGAGLQAGYGSGVIVSEDGLVLTVFSLLIDARRIRAVTADGTPYEADVLHRDRTRQLALLQLKRPTPGPARRGRTEETETAADGKVGPLPFFDLAREATLTPGDWVLAAGNAFKVADGAEPVSLAHGIFSARTRLDARRRLKDFPYRGDVLVIDAITSNPGAPGSAMVNLDGEFVGMIGRVVVSNATHTHFNYAVPRDVLYEFFVDATTGRATTAAAGAPAAKPLDLGIRLSRFGYRKVLPFVEHVRSGSPAFAAGVRNDDLILSVNGRSVATKADCESLMRNLPPGEPVLLVVRRKRAILTIPIEPDQPKNQTKENPKPQEAGATKEEG